jgi:hypothetical protein
VIQSTGCFNEHVYAKGKILQIHSTYAIMDDFLQSLVSDNVPGLNLQQCSMKSASFFVVLYNSSIPFVLVEKLMSVLNARCPPPCFSNQHTMLFDILIPTLQKTHRLDSLSLTSIFLYYPPSYLEPLPRWLWTRAPTRTPLIASSHA